jgi:hypothetical protein
MVRRGDSEGRALDFAFGDTWFGGRRARRQNQQNACDRAKHHA